MRRFNPRGLRQHLPSVRLHHRERDGEPPPAQPLTDLLHEFPDQRLDVGIDNGSTGALILSPHRGHLMRPCHRDFGEPSRQVVPDTPLVVGVREGEEEIHRDGDGAAVCLTHPIGDAVSQGLEGGIGQRQHHPSEVIHPFSDAEAVGPVDKRSRTHGLKVVRVLLVGALEVRDVFEAGGGHIEDARALTGEQSIRGQGRAENQGGHIRQRSREVLENVEHRAGRLGRRGGAFDNGDTMRCLVDRHQIRKCSPRIDPNAHAHCVSSHREKALA